MRARAFQSTGIRPARSGGAADAASIAAPYPHSPVPLRESRHRAARGQESLAQHRKAMPWPLVLFIILVPLPVSFTLGSTVLPPYRIFLTVMFLPCLLRWLGGKAGPVRVSDIALLLYCCWAALSLLVVNGPGAFIRPAGLILVETMGAYLLARCYIRDADDFLQVVRMLFICVVCILPLALIEAFTGRNITRELFSWGFPTYSNVYMPPRLGLRRVQAGFNHPIHFGVFVGGLLACTHLALGYGQTFARRWFRSGIVLFTAGLCLSSGPLTGIVGQIMLMGWNHVLRSFRLRWGLLAGIILSMYLFIIIFANRSPSAIFISYFAFDESSAWIRLLTWQYGTQSILDHPLFGVGYGPWNHPGWLTPSVDMYWIIDSLRFGIPAGLFLMTAFFSAGLAAGFKKGLDDRTCAYRFAYLVTMAGFFLAGWAVDFWNGVYVEFMFLLGSGMWILDVEAPSPARTPSAPDTRPALARAARGGYKRRDR